MSSFINNKDTTTNPPDGYRALSTEELRELLHNEQRMDQIVGLSGEKFQEMQVDRETLLASNRRVAEESLAQRPRLNNGKLQLAEKYRELSNLATACWDKQRRLEGQKRSLQTAQNLLREEVARAEAQSEELLESFMEGSVPLEGFLDSFHSSRKSYHVRRAQVEKVHDAGRQQGKLKKQQQEEQQQKEQQEKEEEEKKRSSMERLPEPQRPNGYAAAQQAPPPPRIFLLRQGLTPALLLPSHFPLSPPASAPALHHHPHHHHLHPPDALLGQTHILSPSGGLSAHGQPVGLRVIGQLQGGWPPGGRPVRLQQLYRPSPQQQPEPPYR